LQDINLHIKSRTLTLVEGPSGSGKTTLLEALLRELPPPSSLLQASSGFDILNGIAYCSQQPWLRNDTVRGNIVGNMPYNEAWYRSVPYACALDMVIHKPNRGLAGNGGTMLSGGQKQRIVSQDQVRVAKHPANIVLVVVAGVGLWDLLPTATASSG
jgi:ABC-type multidrug transport system fused ATPase/permease subunit